MSVRIPLTGKHAVGHYAFVVVDDADAARVRQFKWKATPLLTGGRSYAVRNTRIGGKHKTVYLHRFVMEYDGDMLVDHINHDTMDCRRINLRLASRSLNGLNCAPALFNGTCAWCGHAFERPGDAGGHTRRYCSDEHLNASLLKRSRARYAARQGKKTAGPSSPLPALG